MPKREVTLTNNKTGEQVKVNGQFEPEEWRQLELFLKYAEELRETRFVRAGAGTCLKLHYDKDKGVSTSASLPDPDAPRVRPWRSPLGRESVAGDVPKPARVAVKSAQVRGPQTMSGRGHLRSQLKQRACTMTPPLQ